MKKSILLLLLCTLSLLVHSQSIRDYEIAKRFVESATHAHVSDFDIVHLDGTELARMGTVENKLTVYYGDLNISASVNLSRVYNLETILGADIICLYTDGIAEVSNGLIRAPDVFFNKCIYGDSSSDQGAIWFVGYKFTLSIHWGDNLLDTLDLESDATAGDGWTFDDGWQHSDTLTDTLSIPLSGLTEGELYRVEITVSGRTTGSVTATFAGTAGTAISSNGTVIENLLADTVSSGEAELLLIPTSTFDGTITSVTIKPRI